MRSKTSYFNPTLFLKNLTRFWPIWALYTLIWTLYLPLPIFTYYVNVSRSGSLADRMEALHRMADSDILYACRGNGVILAFLFGLLAAMAVFSYLYNARSAGLMHTLPIKREGLFLTNYLSGLAFLFLPHLVVALLTALAEAAAGIFNGYALGLWLLIQCGSTFFFYTFAVFCAMFTGHILALPAFYCILNFLAAGLTILLNELVSQFTFGYVGGDLLGRATEWLTPTFHLISQLRFRDAVVDAAQGITERLFTGQQYVLAYDLVAVILLICALVLYHRRHVETAGDVIAVPWAKPLFKYGFAFCLSLAGGLLLFTMVPSFGSVVLTLTVLLILCGAIGVFVAEMLLQKSFRVFHKKSWLSCGALTLVLAALMLGLSSDLFGLETWVPNPDDVQSVYLNLSGDFPPYDDGSSISGNFTDPATRAAVTALHQTIVDHRANLQDGRTADGGPGRDGVHLYVRVNYTLINGSQTERNYFFPITSDLTPDPATLEGQLLALVNSPAVRADAYLPLGTESTAVDGSLTVFNTVTGQAEPFTFSAQQAQVVGEAVKADLAAGRLGIHYLSSDDPQRLANCSYFDLNLVWFQSGGSNDRATRSVCITPQFTATSLFAALEEVGALDDTHMLPSYQQWLNQLANQESNAAAFELAPSAAATTTVN